MSQEFEKVSILRFFISRFAYQCLFVLFGGALCFLGFAGFDLWPLALVSHVPLILVLRSLSRTTSPQRVFILGLLFGFVAMTGGYYWLIETLQYYSGLPDSICFLIGALLFLYMGAQYGLLSWMWWKAYRRGVSALWSFVIVGAATEFIFPSLFPFYYGASFHNLPLLLQVADLGGPLLVSIFCYLVNGMVAEILFHRSHFFRSRSFIVGFLLIVIWVGYGSFQLSLQENKMEQAEKLEVGLVQVNMGIFQKREDPNEGLRKHVQHSLELERQHSLDLIVWPESAYTYVLPERVRNFKRRVTGDIKTPVLFGGISSRTVSGRRQLFNSAFLVDEKGDLLGTYDKIFLLAFGEYMPFGEYFPYLYELSPSTGRFQKGRHTHAFELNSKRISTLICYEDIIPGFVRKVVLENNPHLLVNVTNDAWFGDTTEPWIHLALAKFRAVEHHRALVRSTNSGVSAVIDPVGRVMTHTGVYTEETLTASVPLLTGKTVYAQLGDWPGWLSIFSFVFILFRRKLVS